MPIIGRRRLTGINEVGHVTDPEGTPTDVNWGNTKQEGVQLQLATSSIDLMSAQAKMKEDVTLTEASIQLQIALINADAQALQYLWGMPAAALAGDLGGTPTPEVLTIQEGNLGTEERALYVIAPGPASTRRVQARRCRVADLGGLAFASTDYQTPEATWEVLNPTSAMTQAPLVITDAV